jgi:hypothetical protein
MTTGRVVILNPSRADSIKRREFILDSLRSSGLEYLEEIEESRIVITWHGEPKPVRTRAVTRKRTLPAPVTLEKALKSRFNCEPDEFEYFDEIIRLAAEREGIQVRQIQIRTKWETEQWRETWAVTIGDYLAVNRADGYWTITHLGSGLVAASASTLRDAIRVARDVAHWPEWAMILTKDDVTPEFKRKASEAFKQVAA